MTPRLLGLAGGLVFAALFTGCATPKVNVDYSAFKESRPRSIVVLPPLNDSPDVKATYGVLSQATAPLAEAGYYVLPVALVDETFRQNGLTTPGDIHQVPPGKLREIFGADAAMYIVVKEYGTKYTVISSTILVSAEAKLVDLKNGSVLWRGQASASSDEGGNNSGGGLIGALITAAVNQIVREVQEDAALPIADRASARLLSAGRPGGLLYGPHSPKYGTD